MNELEDWMSDWIACPDEYLDGGYGDEDDLFPQCAPHLNVKKEMPQDVKVVSDKILFEIHEKLRGKVDYEEQLWNSILQCISQSIPDSISNDLVDRDISVSSLGHSNISKTVKKRLSGLVDEALLSLARDLYTNPEESIHELVERISQYPKHGWMLRMLAHQKPSSLEKQQAFLDVANGHPDWQYIEDVLGSHERG